MSSSGGFGQSLTLTLGITIGCCAQPANSSAESAHPSCRLRTGLFGIPDDFGMFTLHLRYLGFLLGLEALVRIMVGLDDLFARLNSNITGLISALDTLIGVEVKRQPHTGYAGDQVRQQRLND